MADSPQMDRDNGLLRGRRLLLHDSNLENAKHYNYFRDYDPAIGRYIESDLIGLAAGPNTFIYAWNNATRWRDLRGLSPADVQGVAGDVRRSFGDIRPGRDDVGFQPMPPGKSGGTDWWNGQMWVDPSWADKLCFTRKDYEELFFILFHESMHSSDDIVTRFFTSNSESDDHHNGIYRRELFERSRPKRWPGGAMWGIARDKPLDMDQLYKDYRGRTPACCNAK